MVNQTVVIEEFSAFELREEQWHLATFTGRSFTPADFAD